MEKLIALLIIVSSSAFCIQYDGLRVKYGPSDDLADKEYFFKIPRTIGEAESKGYQKTLPPPGPRKRLQLYCLSDKIICPLYEPSGFIAGLQLAFPVDEFQWPTINPEKSYVKWSIPASEDEPSRDYWTITHYYVSEDYVMSGAGKRIDGDTLQNGGVWVTDLDGTFLKISTTEAELKDILYVKESCIPKMGIHYQYNLTKESSCESISPWVALTTGGDLVGIQFFMFGEISKEATNLYERVNNMTKAEVRGAIPTAPDCVYDLLQMYTAVTLHIYFIDDPWTITCGSEDAPIFGVK